jgi:tetratricopeptide (TPR) repeat protein
MQKEDIANWTTAAKLYENGRLKDAITSFSNLQEYSKACFNLAVIYQSQNLHSNALDCFDKSMSKDRYFALCLFQRAYSLFAQKDYYLAADDFTSVVELMLDNDFIDYSQLGMKFKLYKCEALYNRSICWYKSGDFQAANQDIQAAQKVSITESQRSVINDLSVSF